MVAKSQFRLFFVLSLKQLKAASARLLAYYPIVQIRLTTDTFHGATIMRMNSAMLTRFLDRGSGPALIINEHVNRSVSLFEAIDCVVQLAGNERYCANAVPNFHSMR